jgi:chromosomal replication initiator protein
MESVWPRCLERLEAEFSAEDVHTWLKPLQASPQGEGLVLYAPNAFVVDTVRERYLARIRELIAHYAGLPTPVSLEVGSTAREAAPAPVAIPAARGSGPAVEFHGNLDKHYTFDNFVEGRSNQLGRAAALQVALNPGRDYNPLLLYGGTGLGKTHLMYAAGNLMRANNPGMRVLYLRSEQFFSAMMKSLQEKSMDQFKRQFQQVDALLIDDIQFFAGKNTTQEEFFHTFNTLFDGKQQIILTCDRYPREVENLEPRLKSRLGWGLSVAIEPPDFETRAAILTAKANERRMGPAGGRGLPHRQAHALERARPRRRAQHAGGAQQLHGPADHAGVRAGDAARPVARAGAGDLHQQYPEDRGRLLSAAHGGHVVEAADAFLGAPAADGDGAGQGPDRT